METLNNAALFDEGVTAERLEALRAHYSALYPGWAQGHVLDSIERQFPGDQVVADWVAQQCAEIKPQY